MKANRSGLSLLFLLGTAVFLLAAQQSDEERKLLAELPAKAEKGDAQSQYELGKAFAKGGFGVATNYVEAVKWWRKAAEQNHALAQYVFTRVALSTGERQKAMRFDTAGKSVEHSLEELLIAMNGGSD